jgi:hypothetical protein
MITGTASIRVPHKAPLLRREYLSLRADGWRAVDALQHARVVAAFSKRSGSDVRLTLVPDHDADLSYLDQREFADVRAAEYERARHAGVWGLKAEYRNEATDQWEETDSVYGFIGDDWKRSGYDADLMRSALAARLQSIRLWRAMCKAAP